VVLASPLNNLVVVCFFFVKPRIPCQLDGNFDYLNNHFNYICTIIFIVKIPLQFEMNLELNGGGGGGGGGGLPPGPITRTLPWS
jgi:hypothetical protein